MLQFNDDNFQQEVLQSDKPVLVDFWATWCQPCIKLTPILEELAEEYGDKIKFGKMNVEEAPSTPGQYGIMSIPTIMIFKGGNVAEQAVGFMPRKKLEEVIKKVL